jgi:hypothetical protein
VSQRPPKSPAALLSLKRLLKRSAKHQLRVLGALIAGVYVVVPASCDLASRAWRDLAPRSPLGAASRAPLRVCADHLTDAERARLKADPSAVTAQQVSPRLALVGVGAQLVEVSASTCQIAFEVGILPDHAERLLNDQTVMSLAVEAPSLTLLTEDLMLSPRGQKLQAELAEAREGVMKKAEALLPKLTERLKGSLDPALAERLLADPVIITALKGAVTNELIGRVDWEGLAGGVLDSEELSAIGELAVRHVSKKEVVYGAWGGGVNGGKAAIDRVKKTSQAQGREGVLVLDAALCALKAGSYGVVGLSPAPLAKAAIWVMGDVESDLCDEITAGAKGVVTGALKGGAKTFAQESFNSLKREGDASLSMAQKLAADAWSKADGAGRMRGLWLAVAGNEALRDHVVSAYGEPAWESLKAATLEVSKSAEVEALVGEAAEELKALSKRALTALILDREGKGPNPLLLAVAQEQLGGRARPVVRVAPPPPGVEGKRVSDGYIFPSLPTLTQAPSAKEVR